MVKRDPQTDEYVGIQCDKCERMSPPSAELIINHGLVNMGWWCRGGTHLCPDHAHLGEVAV